MKYIQLFIVLLFAYYTANAQNKIKGYEYWFDNDYTNKVVTSITPVPLFALNTLVPTTGLTSGIHTVQIRTWNESALFSSTLSQFFYKMPETAASTTIVAYEYWIDNDYASAVSVTTPIQQYAAINQLINAQALITGIHTFNIRFKDNTQKWSSALSQFFYKMPETAESSNIVAYEYWIDNDYASAVSVTTPIQQYAAINQLINAQALSNGIHTLNIRFKDNTQKWSSTLSQFFYKIPETTAVSSIVTYEYWIDNDYESAVSVSTTAQQQVSVNQLINVLELSNGIHTFNIRFKDNAKQWGSILSQFFYKIPSQTVANNLITAYRYWVDDDFEKATNVMLSTAVQQFNLIDNITLTQVTRGEHSINFQFKDAMGLWSLVTTDSIQNITTVGIMDNTFEKNISFYPNPTDGLIHVDLGAKYKEININVFDANGRQIKQSQYAKAQTLKINLNECKSGIYFMSITSDDKKATLRVIKK